MKDNTIDLFVGSFYNVDSIKLPDGISFAGNYYQNKLLNIFNPKVSVSFIYEKQDNNVKESSNELFVFLKHQKPFHNLGRTILLLFSKLPKHNIENILLYNFNIYYIPLFLYYKYVMKKKIVIIIADAPFLVKNNIINRCLLKLIKSASGLITLRKIKELNTSQVKNDIIPGIIDRTAFDKCNTKIHNTVIMSGSLGMTTGLLLALDFFSSQSRFKLFITGKPYLMTDETFNSYLEKFSSSSIHYLGILNYQEYIKLLSSCEFGLSLRDPGDIEHEFNFPSKIIEYVSYEILVVSSLGYPELDESTYFKTDFSTQGLQDCFNKIDAIPPIQRHNLVKNSREFIFNLCSESKIKEKIERLLNDC